jgi:polyisoprenoid-binding protein YceI
VQLFAGRLNGLTRHRQGAAYLTFVMIDRPYHSAVHFNVRHMGIAWVRGEFPVLKSTLNWNNDEIGNRGLNSILIRLL